MGFEIENGILKKYIEEQGVTDIIIPESVTCIGGRSFLFCKNVTSVIIPENVKQIRPAAFAYGKSLVSVTIPDSITSIEKYTFWSCSNLTSVMIPDSVTNIGESAFDGCSCLTSVVIPDSVTSIGIDAFDCCWDLVLTIFGIRIPAVMIKDDNLNKAYAMLKSRKFSVSMTNEIKYAFLVGDYLKTNHADAEEYIRKNFLDIARFLIDYDNREAIAKFIRMKKFFTQENTDELLQYAIEQEKHEITLMLTNHKEAMGWYTHLADRLKL